MKVNYSQPNLVKKAVDALMLFHEEVTVRSPLLIYYLFTANPP